MYTTFFYIWFMKRYRISFNVVCFKNETNIEAMFIFIKCSEVLRTSDISWFKVK